MCLVPYLRRPEDIPTVRWISMNTDPWNLVLPSCGQER